MIPSTDFGINLSSSHYTSAGENVFINGPLDNCTEFAFGRALEKGLIDPYSGIGLKIRGHAGKWDDQAGFFSSEVQVDSFVVWDPNQGGAGSVGHVAFVERINTDGSFVISEYNWNYGDGKFNSRTIFPGTDAFQTAKFIHLNPEPQQPPEPPPSVPQPPFPFSGWEALPEHANDIDAGPNDTAWKIGTNEVFGGYGIYQWDGSSWTEVGGGAVRIAVDETGTPWVVNDVGNIYRRSDNSWQLIDGKAKDIAIGDGQVWKIGTNTVGGGHGIHQWNGSSWTEVGGGAVRIAVDETGTPWVVNDVGNIYRRSGSSWQLLDGQAKDIDIGADGSVWIIGTNSVEGGYGVYKWHDSRWVQVPGGAVGISVAADGTPWLVNSSGNIFSSTKPLSFSGWEALPEHANDIDAGPNDTAWKIGTNEVFGGYGIYQWDGSSWTEVGGGAVRIAVDETGTPWVVNDVGNIYRRSGNSWQLIDGKAKDIAIGDGQVWKIGTNTVGGGHGIHQWNGSSWTEVGGGAVRIAVDETGTPWVVNDVGNIYRRSGSSWQLLDGQAKDIDIGADGSVWIIGTNSVEGGYGVYKWHDSRWVQVPGGAVGISVAADGTPWLVNSSGNIFSAKKQTIASLQSSSITGGAGHDTLLGSAGNDILLGLEGNDNIVGNAGDDLIRGGLGHDVLTGDNLAGGQGDDIFILAAGQGTDLILDFEIGHDLIGLEDGLTFGALTLNSNQNSTFIQFGEDVLAEVQGIHVLHESDFVVIG